MIDRATVDQPPALDPPADLAALDPRSALLDGYRLQALDALRRRHALNAEMFTIFNCGGSLAAFAAACIEHEAATRELGAALSTIGHVGNSEGIA